MTGLVSILLDEGKWLAASMTLAVAAVGLMSSRIQPPGMTPRSRTATLMDLFFGVTIGTMAFGHLLGVSLKLSLGTLEGSAFWLSLLGVALAAPSWTLLIRTVRRFHQPERSQETTVGLNAWVAATLLVLGVHNLPLAAPGLFNIGYQLHSRRIVGWAFVALTVMLNAALYVAALVFAASGQTFEQFSGMQ